MGTIIRKCEFGVEHSRSACRCSSKHVTIRPVVCNSPSEHSGFNPEYQPKHRKEDNDQTDDS